MCGCGLIRFDWLLNQMSLNPGWFRDLGDFTFLSPAHFKLVEEHRGNKSWMWNNQKSSHFGRILCSHIAILNGFFLFQHDNALVVKVRSLKEWFSQIAVEDLDLNTIQHLWGELINVLAAKWPKISVAPFQTLVNSLPSRVEAVIAAD